MSDLNKLDLKSAIEGLKAKKFSSVELTKDCLEAIKSKDSEIHAFITVTEEAALTQAKISDGLIQANGENAFSTHPLLGVPYSLKDNFCTEGVLTTAASNILKNFIPPYESTVSKKIKDAGAVLLGKTNMDSFAHGSSTETSDFFTTRNPHNTDRLPGGSSGGSAASLASDMAVFSIGSETAGSIRQPASWCGVVGLKPTYGRVSRYGVISMASSTDSPGPLGKTVWDTAKLLELIAGKDKHDATSSELSVERYSQSQNNLTQKKKFKLGLPSSYLISDMEAGVLSKFEEVKKLLELAGHEIVEIDMLNPKYSIAVYTIIQRSEVSSNLARFDGIRFGFERENFGEETKRRIMMGAYTLSAGYYDKYYSLAQKVRTLVINDFNKAFGQVDAIIAPVSPSTALPVGSSKDAAMFGELQDVLVEPSSIAGLPGISVPCGYSNGLPVGFGIVADRFKESVIISLASEVENAVNLRK